MKTTLVIALSAIFCGALAPLYAAGPAMDAAVKAAAPDSGAKLDAICLATFQAVKEAPDDADKIFEAVLAQRKDWTASEVYAILRSILLARPDLSDEIATLIERKTKWEKAKNAAASEDEKDKEGVGAEGTLTAKEKLIAAVVEQEKDKLTPMLARLVDVLYRADLHAGVPENALNMVIGTVAGVYGYSYNRAHSQIGNNTNGVSIPVRPVEVIVAPLPMTRH